MKNASIRCPHGSMLSCQPCMRWYARNYLDDFRRWVESAEFDWPAELTTHLDRISAILDREPLTLRADTASGESEIERRLLD